jgi:hypothetical protein
MKINFYPNCMQTKYYVGKKFIYNNICLIKAENSPFGSYWGFGGSILGYFVENFIHSILT